MDRKIFISINIPPKSRKRLFAKAEKWQDLPVKWTKEENLHVTLLFLGYIDDDTIQEVIRQTMEATKGEDIFDLVFDEITLAPNQEEPKMLWLTGKPNEALKNLHEKIEKALGTFITPKKSFRPHITLGRIRKNKWQELPSPPTISEKYELVVPVETVDIMASHFGEGNREYTIVESCPLK